jgi:3-hydroxyisobutyrate dehydrogenase-like beta-hydroxyacid dehydrogenase
MATRLSGVADVVVHDIRPEACVGFAAAASPAELAGRADIVFACLTDPAQYRAAVLGPAGLVQGARMRHYVHLGTSGRDLVVELAHGLAGTARTLDAPITGGPGRAAAGTLTVMAAGPAESFTVAEPLLRAFATTIVNLGPTPGTAQTMKVINNAISLTNLAIASEAMLLGAKAGIPAEAMLAVLNTGSGQNSATLTKIPNNILPGRFDFGGTLHIVVKDLELFLATAQAESTPFRLAAATLQAYREALANGAPTDDVTTVIRPMERAAGTELRARNPA